MNEQLPDLQKPELLKFTADPQMHREAERPDQTTCSSEGGRETLNEEHRL